jgi:hypothetical protein
MEETTERVTERHGGKAGARLAFIPTSITSWEFEAGATPINSFKNVTVRGFIASFKM